MASREGCAGALMSPWWGAGQPLSRLALHWQELHVLESWPKFAARFKGVPKLESSYKLYRQTCCAAFMSRSFCDDGKVSPLTQQVHLVLCLSGLGWNLCLLVPASLTRGGTVTETFIPRPSTCPALPRPILTLIHHWNVQLLPWAPELTAGEMNISEVSHSTCSPSRKPHALLFPPLTPTALRWDAGACASHTSGGVTSDSASPHEAVFVLHFRKRFHFGIKYPLTLIL